MESNKLSIRKKQLQKLKRKGNNPANALNVLHVKIMNIFSPYVSKHNLYHKNQIMFVILPNRERWHYLAIKQLSVLLREITSKDFGYFFFFKLSSFV